MNSESKWDLEFHDSKLIAAHPMGHQLFLFFDAYLHSAGNGYHQVVLCILKNGEVRGNLPPLPADIYRGNLESSSHRFDNVFELPFHCAETVKLSFVFKKTGAEAEITGLGLDIQRLGEPVWIERTEGMGT